MEKQQKVAMADMGHMGLSDAALFIRDSPVCAVGIQPEKVDKADRGRSPIVDLQLESRPGEKGLMLSAITDTRTVYGDTDLVIVATPTDYGTEQNYFNVSSVEAMVEAVLRIQSDAYTVIRFVILLGSTKEVGSKYPGGCVLLSPEFLKEGRTLYDSLYPSRIILGLDARGPVQMEKTCMFAGLLKGATLKENVSIRYMDATKTEAVKLFSNTYLAMRVASFNELDTYAEMYGLNIRNMVENVRLDPRISTHYSSPSFGYEGYCLPKDTRQLLINYGSIPNCVMMAIVQTNQTREDFIAGQVLSKSPKVAGIYHLTMKTDSDNFRHSSTLGITRQLEKKGVRVIIYKSALEAGAFLDMEITSDLEEFKQRSDVILANRCDGQLKDVRDKVYTGSLSLCD